MTLQSPGIDVTVTDESFYTPASPGTTPLIVIATAQNKMNATKTAIASGTLQSNVGIAFTITSQKDLLNQYGTPYFEKTATSSPVNGSEISEYGLMAANDYLSVSSSAFVVRADIDLDQLVGQANPPTAAPHDGSIWFNTTSTRWGINEWNGLPPSATNGQTFVAQTPIVLTDANDILNINSAGAPINIGSIGDYAVVIRTIKGAASGIADTSRENITYWYKSPGNGGVAGGGTAVTAGQWVQLGTQAWVASNPAFVGNTISAQYASVTGGAMTIGYHTITVPANQTLAQIVTLINAAQITGVTAFANSLNQLSLFTNGVNSSQDNSTLANAIIVGNVTGDLSANLGLTANTTYLGPVLQQSPHTQVPEWKLTDIVNDTTIPYPSGPRPTGSVWLKTTAPSNGAQYVIQQYSSTTMLWNNVTCPIYTSMVNALYSLDTAGGGQHINIGTIYAEANVNEYSIAYDLTPQTAAFKLWQRVGTGFTTITSGILNTTFAGTGTQTFKLSESLVGVNSMSASKLISVTTTGALTDISLIVNAINNAGFVNLVATITQDNRLQISHTAGGDFRFTDGVSGLIGKIFVPYSTTLYTGTANFYNLSKTSYSDTTLGNAPFALGASETYVATNWQPLSVSNFVAQATAPTNPPVDGQLWYNPSLEDVDIMIHNGKTWVGYRNQYSPYFNAGNSASVGPFVGVSNPWTNATKTGDLWISTADLENFPKIYRYNANIQTGPLNSKWQLIDNTDHVSENGIIFADARYNVSGALGNTPGSIAALLTNNYLDPDAPDPTLYPKGMMLWNLRRSGGNVKKYHINYFSNITVNSRYDSVNSLVGLPFVSGESTTGYAFNRWVTASPNNEDGTGSFVRHAQRSVVVAALKSVIDTSTDIRDEERRNFNLIACPGYPEVISNMINLNISRGITSFVVGDTPFRLPSDATSITNWGSNVKLAYDNGDAGMVSYDDYMGVFYPQGLNTDLSGSQIVIPASSMMLKTIALSDNASYPWFAPAGTRRGAITNATDVGYVDAQTGEFISTSLSTGQRDALYNVSINPITIFAGAGILNFGQKTRANSASAMDRINVARLVIYIRQQLNKLSRPYIFEPNDPITRNELGQACDSFLLQLVGLRALQDYAVVCDSTNNTTTTEARNELWVDIAILPVKAVEFIYIPVRVSNTGKL